MSFLKRTCIYAGTLLIFAGGCSKTAPGVKLVGMWDLRFNAADSNDDHKLESSERNYIQSYPYPAYRFRPDGTGDYITIGSAPVTWQLSPGNDTLRITDSTGLTDMLPIYSLTDDELIFYTVSNNRWYWGGFEKQH